MQAVRFKVIHFLEVKRYKNAAIPAVTNDR